MHSHYYGETLFAALGRRSAVPRVELSDGQSFMVTSTSRFALRGGFVDLQTRLAWMAGQGIGHQLITFPGALGPDVLPIDEAAPLVHDVNDELASVRGTHPQHFSALAGLPLADIDAAVAELERARTRLQLRGAILPCNYFLSLTRMERLHPVLEAASRLGAHLMIHPGLRHDEDLAPHVYDDLTMHRASTIDLHTAISHATLTLMHADLATRYPGASFQVVNLGGALPMLVERMDHIVMTRAPDAPRPSSLFDGLVFDSASLGPRALEIAVAVLGPDRVMLGTDYPIFDSRVATEALACAKIDEPTRMAVAAGNARRILGR
jgi:aminocarboxymuconate-semialdehyde decarboxylase